MSESFHIFQTTLGWVGILSSDKGLRRLSLPVSSFVEAYRQLGISIEPDKTPPQSLIDIAERLKRYFSGYKVTFSDELDISGVTEFQLKVWKITQLIPYGETRSYSWVAEHAGNVNAVRSVGQTLGGNPLPVIIPCHRVTAKNGGLGGYSGGIELKRYLLWLEASAFIRDRIS